MTERDRTLRAMHGALDARVARRRALAAVLLLALGAGVWIAAGPAVAPERPELVRRDAPSAHRPAGIGGQAAAAAPTLRYVSIVPSVRTDPSAFIVPVAPSRVEIIRTDEDLVRTLRETGGRAGFARVTGADGSTRIILARGDGVGRSPG